MLFSHKKPPFSGGFFKFIGVIFYLQMLHKGYGDHLKQIRLPLRHYVPINVPA